MNERMNKLLFRAKVLKGFKSHSVRVFFSLCACSAGSFKPQPSSNQPHVRDHFFFYKWKFIYRDREGYLAKEKDKEQVKQMNL